MSNVTPRERNPLPRPGEPAGYVIVFGDRYEHRSGLLPIDRGEAEKRASHLRGLLFEAVIACPGCEQCQETTRLDLEL